MHDLLRRIVSRGFRVFAVIAILAPLSARCEVEQTFNELTVGQRTFKNVTVTTKAKKYVMLMHSEGLANIKVADLSPELRRTLGYAELTEEPPKNKAEALKKWATKQLATVQVGQVRAMELNVAKTLHQHAPEGGVPFVGKPTLQVVLAAASIALLVWMLFCSCLNKICKNAGKPSNPLVWWPFLQVFPLLNAAGMSGYWVFLPPIASIVWCFKIAAACGKSAFTGVCLLLPGISFLAFLYLAFSAPGQRKESQSSSQKEDRRAGSLTLETA